MGLFDTIYLEMKCPKCYDCKYWESFKERLLDHGQCEKLGVDRLITYKNSSCGMFEPHKTIRIKGEAVK